MPSDLAKALPAIADLGVPVVCLVVIVFLVAYFIRHIEKKDELIERMDKRRTDDNDKFSKAVDDFRNVLLTRRD